MKTRLSTLAGLFGAAVFAFLFAPNGTAQCGGLPAGVAPSSWHTQPGEGRLRGPGLVRVADTETTYSSMVGLWHIKFRAEGTPGIPNGTVVDAGYSEWHSDGTEIMNSGGRSPVTSNFCLGVWKQIGLHTYRLNHFATSWDPTGKMLIGPAQIRETVTLGPAGKTFSGSFTIDQFNEAGKRLVHVQGAITGVRLNVYSAVTSIF